MELDMELLLPKKKEDAALPVLILQMKKMKKQLLPFPGQQEKNAGRITAIWPILKA